MIHPYPPNVKKKLWYVTFQNATPWRILPTSLRYSGVNICTYWPSSYNRENMQKQDQTSSLTWPFECIYFGIIHCMGSANQWEATLQWNIVCHWLRSSPEWPSTSVYGVIDNVYHTALHRDGWYILWCPFMFRFQAVGLYAITAYVARTNTESRSYVVTMAMIKYPNFRKKQKKEGLIDHPWTAAIHLRSIYSPWTNEATGAAFKSKWGEITHEIVDSFSQDFPNLFVHGFSIQRSLWQRRMYDFVDTSWIKVFIKFSIQWRRLIRIYTHETRVIS